MKAEMTARDILLLKISFTALIIILSVRFMILPQVEKMNEAQTELVAAEAAAEAIQNKIDEKPQIERELDESTAKLNEMTAPYYGMLENRELDELVTGIAMRHQLFPLSLEIKESESRVPEPYLYSDGGVRDVEAERESAAAAEAAAEEEAEWENPEEAEIAAAAAAAEAAAAGIDITEAEPLQETEGYVHQTAVSMSLRGDEADILTFLDDIWKNYPAIQIKTMKFEQETYADENLDAAGKTRLDCELIVYMCSELGRE